MKLIAQNEKGKTYQADGFKVLYRNTNTISGNNDVNVEEHMHLVSGEVEVTVKEEVNQYAAPASFTIPAETYHKIEAVKDIILVMVEVK